MIAAHALSERASVEILTSYDPGAAWRKAFDGLAKIAELQKVTLTRKHGASARPVAQSQRVALDPDKFGSPRPGEGEKVVDDIRNPGPQPKDDQKDAVAHGVRTLPRLYVMSALMIEKAQNKAVVALIADSCGAVRSVGTKGPYEASFLHAEVKAILKLRGNLPANGLIATTLKPCAMCGGLMQALDPQGQLIKVYARDDAGGAADWDKVLGGPVPGCMSADKETQNCKVFKLRKDTQSKPFSTLFQSAWEGPDKDKIPTDVSEKVIVSQRMV